MQWDLEGESVSEGHSKIPNSKDSKIQSLFVVPPHRIQKIQRFNPCSLCLLTGFKKLNLTIKTNFLNPLSRTCGIESSNLNLKLQTQF